MSAGGQLPALQRSVSPSQLPRQDPSDCGLSRGPPVISAGDVARAERRVANHQDDVEEGTHGDTS